MTQAYPWETVRLISSSDLSAERQLHAWEKIFQDPKFYLTLQEIFRKWTGSISPFQLVSQGWEETFHVSSQRIFLSCTLGGFYNPVYIELDLSLARSWIDRLLGGTGKMAAGGLPLSSMEEGVLQFFSVKVLQQLSPLLKADFFPVRWDGFYKSDLPNTPHWVWNFSAQSQEVQGHFRILVSKNLLEEADSNLPQSNDSDRFWLFENHRIPVQLEIGTVELGTDDLAQMEAGDIVFLDECQIQSDGKQVSGEAYLDFGGDPALRLPIILEQTEEGMQCRLE